MVIDEKNFTLTIYGNFDNVMKFSKDLNTFKKDLKIKNANFRIFSFKEEVFSKINPEDIDKCKNNLEKKDLKKYKIISINIKKIRKFCKTILNFKK